MPRPIYPNRSRRNNLSASLDWRMRRSQRLRRGARLPSANKAARYPRAEDCLDFNCDPQSAICIDCELLDNAA